MPVNLSVALDTLTAPQTGSASYTLAAADRLFPRVMNTASAHNITVPSSLQVGWYTVVEIGTGTGTVVQGSGATVAAETGGGLQTQGQYSQITIFVYENTGGTAAKAIVFGGL